MAYPIGPAEVVSPASSVWDAHCDVLVIGFGAAGASAAIEAARAGADVIVADRFLGGGASALSGGVVYAGGGTAQQQAAGCADTPAAMADYLAHEVGDAVGADTLQRFCADSRELLTWLERLGCVFEGSLPPRKTSYPPDGYYLYYSGNESVAGYRSAAAPAPRGHRAKGHGLSGAVLFAALRRGVDAAGVHVLTQTAARRLLTDPSGAVVGAELRRLPPDSRAARRHARLVARAERWANYAPKLAARWREQADAIERAHAQTYRVHARRGVVLATGGFINNREMMQAHAPKYLPAWPLGTPGCDGSGIRLGQSVGADTAHLQRCSAWRFINPPYAWARGMVVDARGLRVINEEVYGAALGDRICEHGDGRAWLILDTDLRRAALREAWFGGLWGFQKIPALMLMAKPAARAGTIEELAQRLGMPAQNLRETFDAYRAAANGTAYDAFGKSAAMLAPLATPPFHALDISVGSKLFPCPAITLGGLRVDENTGAVLHRSGRAIKNLYAAGRCAVGLASNHYVSGLSLADCIWSGRRVGRQAAAG